MTKYLGLPELASQQGAAVDHLLVLVHLLMLVLFVGWISYFIWVLVRFRRSRNPAADPQGAKGRFAKYIEVLVAVAEGVLLGGLSIPIWARAVDKFPPEKDATVIHVAAQQFAWNARYAGSDGVFGRQDLKWVSTENPMGIDPNDPHGKDDVVSLNQLYVPVNKPVIVHLTSFDVIHCFAVKTMRVAQDVIPGLRIPIWFTPTKTGQFEINCAQLCGIGHYRMRGYLNVVTQQEFDQWLAQKSKSTGKPVSYE